MITRVSHLKRLGVWSVARIQALIMAVFGFLMGLYAALIANLAPETIVGTTGLEARIPPGLLFVVLPLLMLVFYGVIGLVFGALGAWIYNVFAGWMGGIKLYLEEEGKK